MASYPRPTIVRLMTGDLWFWSCRTCPDQCGVTWTASEANDWAAGHARRCPAVLAGLDRLFDAVNALPHYETEAGVTYCAACRSEVVDQMQHTEDHLAATRG